MPDDASDDRPDDAYDEGAGDANDESAGDDATIRRDPAPRPQPVEPSAPENFGQVQVWWGDGKGKTTAALGMAFRAAGHGFRTHVLQFMKGGADSVDDVRGEYNAIAAMPALTCEHSGHYGWHGRADDTDASDHSGQAAAGLARARAIVDGAREADLQSPFAPDAPAEDGVHMLVLDELCYAANRGLVGRDDVVELLDARPRGLELVLTGGHDRPDYAVERADLVTQVRKERHHFDDGVPARRGTEY